jgi:hypothetical protein
MRCDGVDLARASHSDWSSGTHTHLTSHEDSDRDRGAPHDRSDRSHDHPGAFPTLHVHANTVFQPSISLDQPAYAPRVLAQLAHAFDVTGNMTQ